MKNENRRGFLKKSGLILAGIVTGATKIFSGFQEKTEGLKEKLRQTLKLPIEEKIYSLRNLEKEYGLEEIKEVVHQLIKEEVVKTWKEMSESSGKNDLKTYIDILWNKYCKEGGLKWTEKQESSKTVMNCTYCPYVKTFKDLDAVDWGYELYCRTDYYMIEGWNKKIKFERTKTLMQGDDYCNHTYIVETK